MIEKIAMITKAAKYVLPRVTSQYQSLSWQKNVLPSKVLFSRARVLPFLDTPLLDVLRGPRHNLRPRQSGQPADQVR